ncbi:hypothetical protein JQ633_00900 [Bradyrhizobium tropiciagri]|uniref:hypothetical protein n=1 Tax=Bradyrhizobium tropiciagri TaxID=312253 RepID=UPI001BAE0AF2|nr:hypothetical protein [Bradyrhizobium tropiciagri]MBR0868898.1 hypothetical protein [Bradyrhizobium tropiciagri]
MIRLAQVGFVAMTAIFLALTVYWYPVPSIAAACLAICVAAGMLNAGTATGLASGAGCIGAVVIILGGLYLLTYLLFCAGGRCA